MERSDCETEAIFDELGKKFKLMPRKQQMELACHIEYCLQSKKHIIAEAATGVGKTFAYLIPAILLALKTGKKVIISTSGKTLQKQLVDLDLPKLRQIIPFEFSLSLGSENYFCDLRLSQGLQLGLFDTNKDVAVLENIAGLRRKNPEATILDCEFKVPETMMQGISRDANICTAKCLSAKRCAYMMAARKHRNAHVLVANHHKTLHLIKNSSKSLDNVAAIIFDECHNLAETATVVFSDSITSKDVMTTLKDLYYQRQESGILTKLRMSREQQNAQIKAVKAVVERIYLLHETGKNTEQDVRDLDIECLKEVQSSLVQLGNILQRAKVDVLAPYIVRIANFVNAIDSVTKMETGYVQWKQVTNSTWSFTSTPLSVSDLLRKKLFRARKLVTAHVSATVAVNKKMRFYRSRIGIIDAQEFIVESPFDYRRQASIYIPRNMPEPNKKGYLPAAISEIRKLIEHFQGKTLILFTNYKAMNEAHEILSASLHNYTFFKQGDSSTNIIVEKFKETNKGVILGAATLWEGVDIPGPALQCVIIMKLPFGVPSDPVAKAHQEELRKKGVLPFLGYQVPLALIRFRQGFGRLIRAENDSGVVAILDARILTKRYGKTFLKSLPDCPVIRDIGGFHVNKSS